MVTPDGEMVDCFVWSAGHDGVADHGLRHRRRVGQRGLCVDGLRDEILGAREIRTERMREPVPFPHGRGDCSAKTLTISEFNVSAMWSWVFPVMTNSQAAGVIDIGSRPASDAA
jgi:hypothetical protein